MAKTTLPKKASRKPSPTGIPRTYKAALKLGHLPSETGFSDLPDAHKANFVQLTEAGARPGAFCGATSSTDDGYWLVCYKSDGGNCAWVKVRKGDPLSSHE